MFCNFYSVDSGFISPKKDSECEEGATPLLGDDLVNQAGIQRVDDLLKMLNKVTFKAKPLTPNSPMPPPAKYFPAPNLSS